MCCFFFFSSRRRHTRCSRDWSSDVCSSDLLNFIDGSARGLPPSGNTFYQMKSRDTFCPMGPYIVTADEIPDPHRLQVKLWVNGTLKQNYNTSDMAHKIPRCIE